MVVVSLNLASSAVGCRNDEQERSGQSYACDCSFLDTSELDDLELAVCGLSTGEAMAIAELCADDMVGQSPQQCDCLRDTPTFCDLGTCEER